MKNLILAVSLLTMGIAACTGTTGPKSNGASTSQEATRIISLSGFLTEVLYELGHLDKIVGRDVTSTYPASAGDLPNLGHISQLNAEAILALKPNLIFVEADQLAKSEVLQQIQSAGIEFVTVPTSTNFDNSVNAANIITKRLNTKTDKAIKIKTQIEADRIALANFVASQKDTPKVLFIYARGAGRLMVAGTKTPMANMIEKAGGKSAIDSFEGFKALTPESLLEAAPDVILMFNSGLKSLDGREGLAQITGIPQTPAFKNNRIITMDGHYLSSFGPRVGQAALELAQKIHQ